MPTPRKNETQKDYLQRCMSYPEMVDKHPDSGQRAAICYSMYREHQKKSTSKWISELLDKNNESNKTSPSE